MTISSKDIQDVAQAADEMDDEEFDNFMYSLTKDIEMEEPDSDSPLNVIKFRPKGPMH